MTLAADRIVVLSDDIGNPEIITPLKKISGEILWLPVSGIIEEPPIGSWINENDYFNETSGLPIMRQAMEIARCGFLSQDGKDVVKIRNTYSIGKCMAYNVLELLAPIIKKIEILDILKPARVATANDDSRMARLTAAWCRARDAEHILLGAQKHSTMEPNIGIRPISAERKKILKWLDLAARIKSALLPPPAKSEGIISLSNDSTARFRKVLKKPEQNIHLILPLEMIRLGDILNRRIQWAAMTQDFAPGNAEGFLLEILDNERVRINYDFKGICLLDVVQREIGEIMLSYEGAIRDMIKQKGLCEKLEQLSARYFFAGQDFAWENRILAHWARIKGLKTFLIQHGANARDAEKLRGCLPEPFCEKAFIWGTSALNFYHTLGFSDENISIWGNPHIHEYEKISKKNNLRKKARRKLGITENEKVVLLIPSIHVPLYGNSDPRQINLEFREICRGFKNVPEVRLIIRYHPSLSHYERTDIKREIARSEGPANLIEDPGLPLLEALACADAVMGGRSTTLLEAFAMKKVILEETNAESFLGFGAYNSCLFFNPCQNDVEMVLNKFMNLTNSEKIKLEDGGRNLLDDTMQMPKINPESILKL